MIGAGVPLDGWTALIVIATAGVWVLGYWQGHETGYRRGRRDVARRTLEEQTRPPMQVGASRTMRTAPRVTIHGGPNDRRPKQAIDVFDQDRGSEQHGGQA